MEEPDISLDPDLEDLVADDGFALVAGLAALAAVPAREAAGVVFAALVTRFALPSLGMLFAAVLAAEFTLFLAAVPAGFAVVLVELAAFFGAGLSVSLTVFTSLLATVFRIDFFCVLAALLLAGEAALTAGLLALLAAALLVADLVTVAFMVCLHY